ncbi:MAG: metal-dependent hydrolase [Acidimicrobiales bacterium]
MARDHAALAGCLCVAAGRIAGLPAPELLAAAVVGTGAALLPDLDEPGSTVSHLLEPVSGIVARGLRRLAGGHRMATHSLLAGILAGVGTYGLSYLSLGTIDHHSIPATAVPLVVCVALALRGLIPRGFRPGHIAALILGLAAAWLILLHVGIGIWLPLAVGGGWMSHLLGDWLTEGGVPLLWPATRHHYALPILSHTDSWREHLAGLLLLGGLVAAAWSPVAALAATVKP